jgi:hydrogenase 3 maturation protease
MARQVDLREELAGRIRGKVVVVGIGNPCRGDDAAGSLVAKRMKYERSVRVIDAQDVPEHYLCQVANERPDTILMIDSVELDAAPGSVAVLEKDDLSSFWPSTHRMPVNLLMKFLEEETHARIFLIAIQPGRTDFMQPISPEVQSSVEDIADVLGSALRKGRLHPDETAAEDGRTKEVTR